MTGLSEFMLLWNTVDMSRQRIARSSSSPSCSDVLPSKTIAPPLTRPGGRSSRSSAVPRVDLPRPGLADQADELALGDARS